MSERFTAYFEQLERLSTEDLDRSAVDLVLAEKQNVAFVIAHIAEISRRKADLERAYPNLFVYCLQRLGLSEGSVALRIQVANVARRFPQVLAAIAEGRISLSVAGRLAPHLSEENVEKLLRDSAGMTKRAVEEYLVGLRAKPVSRPSIRKLPSRPEREEETGDDPERRRGGGFSETEPGREPVPALETSPRPPAAPPGRIEPARPEVYNFRFAAGKSFREKLLRVAEVLGIENPERSMAEILERGLDLLLEKKAPERRLARRLEREERRRVAARISPGRDFGSARSGGAVTDRRGHATCPARCASASSSERATAASSGVLTGRGARRGRGSRSSTRSRSRSSATTTSASSRPSVPGTTATARSVSTGRSSSARRSRRGGLRGRRSPGCPAGQGEARAPSRSGNASGGRQVSSATGQLGVGKEGVRRNLRREELVPPAARTVDAKRRPMSGEAAGREELLVPCSVTCSHWRRVLSRRENGAHFPAMPTTNSQAPRFLPGERRLLRIALVAIASAALAPASSAEDLEHPLFGAIRRGDNALLASFLRQGAPTGVRRADGTTPLVFAALRGDAESVRLLLAHGADPGAANAAGATALLWGAGDAEKVRLLLDRGADPHARSALGNTALLAAAAHWDGAETVKLLLDRGADPGAHDNNGLSALERAVDSGSIETARLILERASKDVRANAKNSLCLRLAASQGDVEMVELLLDHGADPNASDGEYSGHALNYALLAEEPGVVEVLVRRGCDLTLPTPIGKVPPAVLAAYTEVGDLTAVRLLAEGASTSVPRTSVRRPQWNGLAGAATGTSWSCSGGSAPATS